MGPESAYCYYYKYLISTLHVLASNFTNTAKSTITAVVYLYKKGTNRPS